MAYNLPLITLGHTGLRVTRLGIGGAYCKSVEGYKAALDCGVTYVDTARAYLEGEDERLIGQAIAGRRHELVLSSKSIQRDAAGARQDLETSLRLLGTDYLDVWHLHGLDGEKDQEQALGPGGAYEAAVKAREQGLVRFIGITGHKWAEIGKAVSTGLFDVVLCWYNAAMKEPEELVFPHTQRLNMGVTIMSAARNDRLFKEPDAPPAEDFYRYVLRYPGVHVALYGLRDVENFERVARALSERATLLPGDVERLEAYGARLRTEGKLNL